MRNLVLLAAGAAALVLSGCETATPYQPASASAEASGGYRDQQIEPNRWRVSFSGNSLTTRDTVERYLLFRSAQLTLQQGYDWFETASRQTDPHTSYTGDLGGYWGPQWGLYGRWGWRYGYWGGAGWDGWDGGPVDIQQVTRYDASAEIIMGRGPKPADPRAFDAHAVSASLQPSIRYPESAQARS